LEIMVDIGSLYVEKPVGSPVEVYTIMPGSHNIGAVDLCKLF